MVVVTSLGTVILKVMDQVTAVNMEAMAVQHMSMGSVVTDILGTAEQVPL